MLQHRVVLKLSYVALSADHVTAHRFVLGLLRLIMSHCSPLCPFSAQWSTRLDRGWAQLASALSHVMRGGASFQSGS